ncbi:LAFE_0G11584g1_1 [Lachancea fermentati]|uniref:LAFE_0G11584g1_1 n=1 Tax=Lachancea fermentati TaxID=4955 RepID=A0A1G4MHV9_LACFM|nr:LAFE_0G11584g1_1 [Lachancea fermentati]
MGLVRLAWWVSRAKLPLLRNEEIRKADGCEREDGARDRVVCGDVVFRRQSGGSPRQQQRLYGGRRAELCTALSVHRSLCAQAVCRPALRPATCSRCASGASHSSLIRRNHSGLSRPRSRPLPTRSSPTPPTPPTPARSPPHSTLLSRTLSETDATNPDPLAPAHSAPARPAPPRLAPVHPTRPTRSPAHSPRQICAGPRRTGKTQRRAPDDAVHIAPRQPCCVPSIEAASVAWCMPRLGRPLRLFANARCTKNRACACLRASGRFVQRQLRTGLGPHNAAGACGRHGVRSGRFGLTELNAKRGPVDRVRFTGPSGAFLKSTEDPQRGAFSGVRTYPAPDSSGSRSRPPIPFFARSPALQWAAFLDASGSIWQTVSARRAPAAALQRRLGAPRKRRVAGAVRGVVGRKQTAILRCGRF